MVKRRKSKSNAVKPVQFKRDVTGYVPSSGPDLTAIKVGLFSDKVNVNTLRDMFKRDELLNAAVKRLASDIFDNWAEIVVFKTNGQVNDSRTDELNHLLNDLDLRRIARQAFISRLLNGFAIVGIGFPGDLNVPVQEFSPLYISVVPYTQIQDVLVDLRIDFPTYGKPSFVKMSRPTGTEDGVETGTQMIMLHADRFVDWVMPSVDDDNPRGMPGILPLYDMLTVKKNADWALGETLYQYAAKHYVFKFPPTMPDDKYNNAISKLKDFNSVATFVYRGDPLEIDDFGGEGQLNPEPYVRYITSLLSIGLGVPYPILFRGLAGGVSDVVQRDYASDVAAIQRNEVEPFLREFLRKIHWDETLVQFNWKPIIEMTQQEQAFIRSRYSLGRNLTAKAVAFYQTAGLSIEFDKDGWIQRVFVKDSKDNILHPPPEPIVPPQPTPGQAPLAPATKPKPKPSPEEEEDAATNQLIIELVKEEPVKTE